MIANITRGERVMIGADFNGRVEEENRGAELVMGRFGLGDKNLDGQAVVDFKQRMEMAEVNVYF